MGPSAASPLVRRVAVMVAVAVAPGLVLAALGLGLARRIESGILGRALASAADATALVATLGIQPHLSEADVRTGLSAPQVAELRRVVEAGSRDEAITRLKVWNADGRVVFSDDPAIIGQTFPVSHELADALTGEVESEVSDLAKAENVADRALGRQLEVYAPLRFGDGPVVGAFEIYVPYDPIAEHVAGDVRGVYTIVAGALVLLYAALLRIARDTRRVHRHAAESRFQAMHDSLTGLPNRRSFHQEVEAALASAAGASSTPAVVFVDLDDFKIVNDTLGHAAGDALLVGVADRLRTSVREGDLVARLGGDEFAILLHDGARGAAQDVCDRVTTALRVPLTAADTEVLASASLGVASADGGCGVAELLRRADVAMYTAKAAGKECYRLFEAVPGAAVHGTG